MFILNVIVGVVSICCIVILILGVIALGGYIGYILNELCCRIFEYIRKLTW